jgi:hypothetical protein
MNFDKFVIEICIRSCRKCLILFLIGEVPTTYEIHVEFHPFLKRGPSYIQHIVGTFLEVMNIYRKQQK